MQEQRAESELPATKSMSLTPTPTQEKQVLRLGKLVIQVAIRAK